VLRIYGVVSDGVSPASNVGDMSALLIISNLEWLYGYKKRFGITAVDMENGCIRYPKDSAYALKRVFEHAMK
jgi:beta-glucosidase/6-phospho-beta-glucosidase/beta-galactosidase